MGDKIKVVWLCHFHNKELSRFFFNKQQQEFAPWISRFIEVFKDQDLYEIHIVSPHSLAKKIKIFNEGIIHYHFFPFLIPFLPNRVSWYFHYKTSFIMINWLVKRIINKINPKLIHMYGTENAYFNYSIFQFKNIIPVFITIQGFISHSMLNNQQVLIRKEVEKKIIEQFNNFGTRNVEMESFIKSINPNAKLFHHEIAITKPRIKRGNYQNINEYDIVFFARVSKEKGIEDLLLAVMLVKKKIPDVKVYIIGPAEKEYLDKLKKKVSEFNISKNVMFLGSLPTISDVHWFAKKAKICVLPTHYDTIPGTILESMFMKIPCIAYPVGGVPSLNEKKETIILVEKGNIDQLAEKIICLLESPKMRKDIARNAFEYVSKRWDERQMKIDIMYAYKKILTKDDSVCDLVNN